MADDSETLKVEQNPPKRGKKFTQKDFDLIAEYVRDELGRRQNNRKDSERDWKEIDRQLRMEPDISYKTGKNGQPKPGMAWMPEIELPLQAQTLETLTADSRRLLAPETGSWFRAHALTTDEYFAKAEAEIKVSGVDQNQPIKLRQDDVDRVVESVIRDLHSQQGGWWDQWDQFNAEAFSYGTGVGRVRMAERLVYVETARGMARRKNLIPVFFARSIKETYLDDTPHRVMNEGQLIGPGVIHTKRQLLADIVMAAQKGSSEPMDENGGWMSKSLKGVEGDAQGLVDVIEWEGDLLVPRSGRESIYVPGSIVTVLVGKGSPKVIRFRFRKYEFSSYVSQPYHIESLGSPYGVGPLQKGRPLQAGATHTFCRLIQSAILNVEPPISYPSDDAAFSSTGGPLIEPRALWPTGGEVKPHQIGNPQALLQVYQAILTHYSDVTGVNAPRLGAQGLSHTTAYSKEQELQRGQIRTVDYVRSVMDNPLSAVIDRQMRMARGSWVGERAVWVADYGGYATLTKNCIPEDAVYEVFGAAGPSEAKAKTAEQIQAIQVVAQMEMAKMQLQQGPALDFAALQKRILEKGGFTDVEQFFASAPAGAPQPPPGGPGVPGGPGGAQQGAPMQAAVQALQPVSDGRLAAAA